MMMLTPRPGTGILSILAESPVVDQVRICFSPKLTACIWLCFPDSDAPQLPAYAVAQVSSFTYFLRLELLFSSGAVTETFLHEPGLTDRMYSQTSRLTRST
jgi:hypothetical protein